MKLKPYNPTNWKDNLVQYPDRFKAVETELSNVFEIEKYEGEVFERGTAIESEKMNKIELGIKENNRFLNTQIDTLKSLQLQVSILQATVSGDINGDVYVDDLQNLDSITLISGVYDEDNNLIYCVDNDGARIEINGYAIAIG